jgi:acyl carrier protein
MDRSEVLQRIGEILRESLDDDGLRVSETTSRDDVATWDSLGHIRILTAVEESFGVRFDLEEVSLITNIGQIVDLVLRKPR